MHFQDTLRKLKGLFAIINVFNPTTQASNLPSNSSPGACWYLLPSTKREISSFLSHILKLLLFLLLILTTWRTTTTKQEGTMFLHYHCSGLEFALQPMAGAWRPLLALFWNTHFFDLVVGPPTAGDPSPAGPFMKWTLLLQLVTWDCFLTPGNPGLHTCTGYFIPTNDVMQP